MLSQPVKSAEHQPPIRTQRRVLSLPAYDVRMRKELAQRRLFVAIGRQVMRVVSLHALDATVVVSAALLAAMMTALTHYSQVLIPLAGLVLLGLVVLPCPLTVIWLVPVTPLNENETTELGEVPVTFRRSTGLPSGPVQF